MERTLQDEPAAEHRLLFGLIFWPPDALITLHAGTTRTEEPMAKRATFRDAQTLARARADRRKAAPQTAPTPTTRPRAKAIPGYRIQPLMPLGIVFADGSCVAADFTVYDGTPCVEALVELGMPKPDGRRAPYTIVLTIHQALAADIIERTEG